MSWKETDSGRSPASRSTVSTASLGLEPKRWSVNVTCSAVAAASVDPDPDPGAASSSATDSAVTQGALAPRAS